MLKISTCSFKGVLPIVLHTFLCLYFLDIPSWVNPSNNFTLLIYPSAINQEFLIWSLLYLSIDLFKWVCVIKNRRSRLHGESIPCKSYPSENWRSANVTLIRSRCVMKLKRSLTSMTSTRTECWRETRWPSCSRRWPTAGTRGPAGAPWRNTSTTSCRRQIPNIMGRNNKEERKGRTI